MESRIRNTLKELTRQKLDAFLVTSAANITYLTKYQSRDSYLLVSKHKNIYFTDSRYIEEAQKHLKRIAEIQQINGSVFKLISQVCAKLRLKRLGFEEEYLSFREFQKISQELGERIKFLPVRGLIEGLRRIKEPEELEKIRQAVSITISAIKFIKKLIVPGKTEIEIVAELERYIRYKGSSGNAFNIIVASGPNTSLPHHIPSLRKIKNNEPVMIDMGVDYLGYKSDLTRVVFLGKINALSRRIYDTVLQAQKQAISLIRPGVRVSEIDKAGRNYINQKGFGAYFAHAIGHGVGLEVHESPRISSKEKTTLMPGMVFTIEPAIYLPGKFGVRIEDMVLVTKNGFKILSNSLSR